MPDVSPLASWGATKAVLDAHGLSSKHALGQNFLVNDGILAHILELSEACEDDIVLEVGPGLGTLSLALLPHVGHIVAVEADKDLPKVLRDTCADYAETSFTLFNMDALGLMESDLREGSESAALVPGFAPVPSRLPNKLVSNLPYAVAATLVLDYFERFGFLDSATVMVQKEVADRMCASVGCKDYGAYTVKLRLHANPTGRFAVGPGNFFPPPRVDSAVVRFDRIKDDEPFGDLTNRERKCACIMADAAFASRRKTISNSCKSYFSRYGSKYAAVVEKLPDILESVSIDPRRRGETLEVADFVVLGKLVNPLID